MVANKFLKGSLIFFLFTGCAFGETTIIYDILCTHQFSDGKKETYQIQRYDYDRRERPTQTLTIRKQDRNGVVTVSHITHGSAMGARPLLHRRSLVYQNLIFDDKSKVQGWIYLYNLEGEKHLLDVQVPSGNLVNTELRKPRRDVPCQIRTGGSE